MRGKKVKKHRSQRFEILDLVPVQIKACDQTCRTSMTSLITFEIGERIAMSN